MMDRLLNGMFAIGLALALSLFVRQTLSITIPPATPFRVTFDLPGDAVPNFRWWCDGGIVKNYTGTLVPKAAEKTADGLSTYTLTVPGLAAGTHSCFVSAFVANVWELSSTPIVFPVGTPAPVGPPPAVPVNIRIVVGGGGPAARP